VVEPIKIWTDLQGNFLAGRAGSAGEELESRAAGGCCCDPAPLAGDPSTEGRWSLCEEEDPHSHSDLEDTQQMLFNLHCICQDSGSQPFFCDVPLVKDVYSQVPPKISV